MNETGERERGEGGRGRIFTHSSCFSSVTAPPPPVLPLVSIETGDGANVAVVAAAKVGAVSKEKTKQVLKA